MATIDIQCPDLGGTVRLSSLVRPKREELAKLFRRAQLLCQEQKSPRPMERFAVHAVSRCVVDGDGNHCLNHSDGRELLAGINPTVLLNLASEALRINTMPPGE